MGLVQRRDTALRAPAWQRLRQLLIVMPGPAAGRDPGIHVSAAVKKDVDGRVKRGHDDGKERALEP